MLSYVFWHWPRAGVDSMLYESAQREFHTVLTAAPPPGFLGSTCHAIVGAPWAAGGGPAYEDWYLQENSAALDELNTAAVTAARRVPHDHLAGMVAGGTAGLYQLELGGHLPSATTAHWFGKPANWSYGRMTDAMRPLLEATGASLWMRRMVLGPTPEFCLRTHGPVSLPPELTVVSIPLSLVWPA